MTEENKKIEVPVKAGAFSKMKRPMMNNSGSLKPKRPVFAQKPMKKVTGRGR